MTKTIDKVKYLVGDSKEEITVTKERKQKSGKVIWGFGEPSKQSMHTSEKEAIWELSEVMERHFSNKPIEIEITFAERLSSTGEEV